MEFLNNFLGIIAAILAIIGYFFSKKNSDEIKKIKNVLQENNIDLQISQKKTTILNKTASSGNGGTSIVGNNNNVGGKK